MFDLKNYTETYTPLSELTPGDYLRFYNKVFIYLGKTLVDNGYKLYVCEPDEPELTAHWTVFDYKLGFRFLKLTKKG